MIIYPFFDSSHLTVLQSAELMRRGKMPSKSELQSGKDILDIGLPSEIKI